jgi:hypothetical protein
MRGTQKKGGRRTASKNSITAYRQGDYCWQVAPQQSLFPLNTLIEK